VAWRQLGDVCCPARLVALAVLGDKLAEVFLCSICALGIVVDVKLRFRQAGRVLSRSCAHGDLEIAVNSQIATLDFFDHSS
jgi:hypothetical protein